MLAVMVPVLRRTLSHRVSVEALIELALWLAIPYLVVGVTWAFLHPGQVGDFESLLRSAVPAGADVMAFGLTVALWPLLIIAPVLCGG